MCAPLLPVSNTTVPPSSCRTAALPCPTSRTIRNGFCFLDGIGIRQFKFVEKKVFLARSVNVYLCNQKVARCCGHSKSCRHQIQWKSDLLLGVPLTHYHL